MAAFGKKYLGNWNVLCFRFKVKRSMGMGVHNLSIGISFKNCIFFWAPTEKYLFVLRVIDSVPFHFPDDLVASSCCSLKCMFSSDPQLQCERKKSFFKESLARVVCHNSCHNSRHSCHNSN